MDGLRETFFQECEELLEVLTDGLAEIDGGDDDPETVNAIFRAVHSIKGGAGAFALDEVVRFAHKFETTLDEVRAGRLEASVDYIRMALRASDVLSDLVRAAQDEVEMAGESVDRLLEEMDAFLPEEAGEEEVIDFQPVAFNGDFSLDLGGMDDEEEAGSIGFTIRFSPLPSLYSRGNETVRLLRCLGDLGTMSVACDTDAIPALDGFGASESYCVWTLTLETAVSEEEVREIFDFVEDDCDLSIEPLMREGDGAAETAPEPEALDVFDLPLQPAPEPQAPPAAASEDPPASDEKTRPARDKAEAPRATVRIDLERVERLINLVGELVINQAVLSQQIFDAEISPSSEIATGLDEFKQLTRDIQESVMAIRAQPVKPLFQRMSRIVREASDQTGKSVLLVTEGEATEVDKTVIERLSDPLTHMIRNAVDHGLESPEKREAAGKPAQGVVTLSAAHRSGRVVIEISDDGAGINRERVRASAIEKNLIPEDAVLTEQEIDNLLFMPGFSTASEISSLSGRGVGMDVVKRSIQGLGGRISIVSEPGKGSTFTISLPLTMAVLDGIVVKVGAETVVVPLTDVVETLQPSSQDLHGMGGGTQVMQVRGEFVPVVDVGYELGFRHKLKSFENQIILLTESDEGVRSALMIDSIQDQRQVVIKGLQENYGDVPGIAAATILGDGRIALILDVAFLVFRAGTLGQGKTGSIAMAG